MDDQTGTPQQRQIALDADRALWAGEVAKMRQLTASDGPDDATMKVFAVLVSLDHVVLARYALAGLCDAADTSHLAGQAEITNVLRHALVSAPPCGPGMICIEHSTPHAVRTLAQAGMLRCTDSPDGA